jgi:hypothetical protein
MSKREVELSKNKKFRAYVVKNSAELIKKLKAGIKRVTEGDGR